MTIGFFGDGGYGVVGVVGKFYEGTAGGFGRFDFGFGHGDGGLNDNRRKGRSGGGGGVDEAGVESRG